MKNFVSVGRKIVGVGRNFKAHALELGNTTPTTEPLIFLKPTSSYAVDGRIWLPPNTNVHHEVELGVVIGKDASHISRNDAMSAVCGYALALDMTARNVQKTAQRDGEPWSVAKGYDTFTPVGQFIPKEKVADPANLRLWCKVQDSMKQDGNTKDMIFDIPTIIEYISSVMKLEPGDLILTGTPEGVGPVKDGEDISCGLEDGSTKEVLSQISFKAHSDY